jgi:tetratricopeptide (TPR) repeat protein
VLRLSHDLCVSKLRRIAVSVLLHVKGHNCSLLLASLLVIAPILSCSALLSDAQSSTDRATPAANLEQIAEAAARYESFLADPPSNTSQSYLAEVRVRLGTAYFMLDRYPDSLKALTPVLSSDSRKQSFTISTSEKVPSADPNARLMLAQAWLICGLDHLKLNQASDAVAPLRRALVLNSTNANARLALGDALARSNQMEEAEKQYDEQLQMTPSLADAWYKVGMVHIQLAADWKSVLTKKSASSALAQQLIAESMLEGEQNWDAARVLLKLAGVSPNTPGVHSDLGRALFALGYAKSAADEFRKELSFDSEDPSAMLGLAQTEALQEQWREANSELDRLARSQPLQLTRLVESAPAGPLRQAWNDGAVKLPQDLAATPEGIFWKTWLTGFSPAGEILSSLTGHPAACTALSPGEGTTPGRWLSESCYRRLSQKLQSQHQLDSAAWGKLVEALFRLGEYEQAMQQAQRLMQSDSGNEWAAYWLSKAHSELAGDCFVKLATLDPSSPRVHQMLAERYLGWGQFSRAEAEYQTAIRLAPSLPDLYLGLGDTYTRKLDWADAVTQYKKTLELAPGSLAALAELGHAYAKLGEWKLAIAQLSQIPSGAPQALAARLDLANAEDQAGETRQAITDLLPFESQDKDGEIHYRLAVFYRKIGDFDHAKEAMQSFQSLRATELAVSHEEIQALENEKQTSSPTVPPGSN